MVEVQRSNRLLLGVHLSESSFIYELVFAQSPDDVLELHFHPLSDDVIFHPQNGI